MAVTIVNVNNTTFSLDGVEYLKNFMSVVYGDKVEIVNVYDSSFVLKERTIYSDWTIDGGGYASAILLQSDLKDVIYNRDNIGTELGYKIINNTSDFNTLVTGGTSGTWLFLSNITLDANKVIPSGVTFEFRNTRIDLNGFNLTGTDTIINSDQSYVFNLNGGAMLGDWLFDYSYPDWFGADGDGVTDETTELQQLLTIGGNILFNKERTYITTGLTMSSTKNTYIHLNGSTLKLTGSGILLDLDNNHNFDLQNVIENGYLDSTTIGSGTAIKNTDTDRTEFKNLLITSFDKGIFLDASADGGWSESCLFLNVTIRECNYGIYLGGSAWTTTTISYGQTRFIGVNISTKDNVAAIAYGFYQEQHTSLYRSFFGTLSIWTEENNDVGFYTDGAFNGVAGQIGIERIGSTGNTAFKVDTNATLIQGDLVVNIAGVFATEFDFVANIDYKGIKKKDVRTLRKQGINSNVREVYDSDATTARIVEKITNTDTIQLRYNSSNPLEVIDHSSEKLFPCRIKNVGKVSTTTSSGTTPDVENLTFLRLNNSGATTITNFTNPIAGQEITVLHLNGNTTIDGTTSGILLQGSIDYVGVANTIHKFIYDGNTAKWRETSRIIG